MHSISLNKKKLQKIFKYTVKMNLRKSKIPHRLCTGKTD